jgi:hypothetical protein
MKKSIWAALLIGIVLLATTGQTEIYKYIDENGQRRWTDDLTQVPKEQRPAHQRMAGEATGDTMGTPSVVQSRSVPEGDSESLDAIEPQGAVTLSREALLKEKAALHAQYQQLMLERQQIQQALSEPQNADALAAASKRAQAYNQKAEAYDNRLAAFNQDVAAYIETNKAMQGQVAE